MMQAIIIRFFHGLQVYNCSRNLQIPFHQVTGAQLAQLLVILLEVFANEAESGSDRRTFEVVLSS